MCGKDAVTSDLQDLLVHGVKGIAQYAKRARALNAPDNAADDFILYAMFTTLTNVNFNATRFVTMIQEAALIRDRVKASYIQAALASSLTPEELTGPAAWQPADDMNGMLRQAADVGINAGLDQVGPDIIGLRSLVLYGLKGVCAYAHHAYVLGKESDEVFAGIEDALDFLSTDPTDVEALLNQSMALGTLNLSVMALLDEANTGTFGAQQPTQVRITPIKGKAILVSGHDLAIWPLCWSKPKTQASTFIRMARCCLLTLTRSSRLIRIWSAITAVLGRISKKSLPSFPAPF